MKKFMETLIKLMKPLNVVLGFSATKSEPQKLCKKGGSAMISNLKRKIGFWKEYDTQRINFTRK